MKLPTRSDYVDKLFEKKECIVENPSSLLHHQWHDHVFRVKSFHWKIIDGSELVRLLQTLHSKFAVMEEAAESKRWIPNMFEIKLKKLVVTKLLLRL